MFKLFVFLFIFSTLSCSESDKDKKDAYMAQVILYSNCEHYINVINLGRVSCRNFEYDIFLIPTEIKVYSNGKILEISVSADNLKEIQESIFIIDNMKIQVKFGRTDRPWSDFCFDLDSYLEITTSDPQISIGYTWSSPLLGSRELNEKKYILERNNKNIFN